MPPPPRGRGGLAEEVAGNGGSFGVQGEGQTGLFGVTRAQTRGGQCQCFGSVSTFSPPRAELMSSSDALYL